MSDHERDAAADYKGAGWINDDALDRAAALRRAREDAALDRAREARRAPEAPSEPARDRLFVVGFCAAFAALVLGSTVANLIQADATDRARNEVRTTREAVCLVLDHLGADASTAAAAAPCKDTPAE